MGTPNNFSILLLRVKDPTTLNEQQARGMELHILEAGKDHNKEVMEKIQASKKKIILPTTFEDLTTIVKGFGGIASILFGGGEHPTHELEAVCKGVEHQQATHQRQDCNGQDIDRADFVHHRQPDPTVFLLPTTCKRPR